MALRPVDKLLAAYLVFVTAVILVRHPLGDSPGTWLLGMHALVGILLALFARLGPGHRAGGVLHDLYPLILVVPLYAEVGLLNEQLGRAVAFANDAVVQEWEAALFGGQISYTWIRASPSVFWSGLLHVAYFSYYPIVAVPPLLFVMRGRAVAARSVILAMMVAFVFCYLWFILFPVAGPNYTFDHPTGPVREVWSARVVYGMLAGGSSFGAAFPSSHVAVTAAATTAVWRHWRALGAAVVIPFALLTIGTVYCQMHYGVDALAGLVVGMGAVPLAAWWERRDRRSE